MKKTIVHGVELTSIQEMVFSKWLVNNNVAMNTLTPEQRTEVVMMFLRQCNQTD